MNHCTANPYSRLLGCCSRGEVRVHMSVGLAATPPTKGIYILGGRKVVIR